MNQKISRGFSLNSEKSLDSIRWELMQPPIHTKRNVASVTVLHVFEHLFSTSTKKQNANIPKGGKKTTGIKNWSAITLHQIVLSKISSSFRESIKCAKNRFPVWKFQRANATKFIGKNTAPEPLLYL